MSESRRVALAVHVLASEDREWIVERFPADQRKVIETHLGELDSLGIEPDAEILNVALDDGRTSSVTGVLLSARARSVFEVLQYEPIAVTVRLLSIRRWPWADDLVALFPEQQRPLLNGAHQGWQAAAPMLSQRIIERLALHLEASSPEPALRQRVTGWWDKLGRAIRKRGFL